MLKEFISAAEFDWTGYRVLHANKITSFGGGKDSVRALAIATMSENPVSQAQANLVVEFCHRFDLLAESEVYRRDPEVIAEKKAQREAIKEMFSDFGIGPCLCCSIPNKYATDHPYFGQFPWYIVQTLIGQFTVGHRKRVWSIDWSDTIVSAKATELFPNEEVTKFEKTIHAYSVEKAREYMKVILLASSSKCEGWTIL